MKLSESRGLHLAIAPIMGVIWRIRLNNKTLRCRWQTRATQWLSAR